MEADNKGEKESKPEEMIQRFADLLAKRLPLLFSFAQTPHFAPPVAQVMHVTILVFFFFDKHTILDIIKYYSSVRPLHENYCNSLVHQILKLKKKQKISKQKSTVLFYSVLSPPPPTPRRGK